MASALMTLRAALERIPALFQRASVPVFGGGNGTPSGSPGAGLSFAFGDRSSSPWWKPNWFQLGVAAPDGAAAMRISSVYACVSIIAQEIARIEMHMWKLDERTGKRSKAHPNFERVLRRPNQYQTRSDFWLHMVMSLLLKGNAYAIATRKEGQIVALHPVPHGSILPVVVQPTGEVFYRLGEWQLSGATEVNLETDTLIPAEEVLHLRLFCTAHPLIGQSPLMACGPAVAQAAAISGGAAAFFSNMSRPSGILFAPKKTYLNDTESARLKERWRAASTESAQGSVMVVGAGYTWQQLTMTAADAQLVEQYRMTIEDIARVFRVPLHLLGDLSKASFNNVDALQRSFHASGLGFYLTHIENAVEDFFGLPMGEYAEFDVEAAFMRVEFADRMTAFAKAVQGGIYTPNEVRAEEHLPSVKGGDMIFLQRQMAPVDQIVEQAKLKPSASQPSAGNDDGPDAEAATKARRPGESRSLAEALSRRAQRRKMAA